MERYNFARTMLENIYLDNYFEGYKDTRKIFPLNLFLMGLYSICISILFLMFFPIIMLLKPLNHKDKS